MPTFSTITTPIMNFLKRPKHLYLSKDRLTLAPMLILSDFFVPFELHCDASKLVIGTVLSQHGRSMLTLVRIIKFAWSL